MSAKLQSLVYLVIGLFFALFTFGIILWSVWGAPTSIIQYVALYSALGLAITSVIVFYSPIVAQRIAVFCCLGMGLYFIPAAGSLVPSAMVRLSPTTFMIFASYYALLGFSLFYPHKTKVSKPTLFLCLAVSAGIFAYTARQRFSQGEFNRPVIAYFSWEPSTSPLTIDQPKDAKWLSDSSRSALEAEKMTGTLRWRGSWGEGDSRPRMIVISSGPIPTDKELKFPKSAEVIYIFDGTSWKTIPKRAELYSSFATLDTEGMLWQKSTRGGRQGTSAFSWPKVNQ
jgi:hypothetical protein